MLKESVVIFKPPSSRMLTNKTVTKFKVSLFSHCGQYVSILIVIENHYGGFILQEKRINKFNLKFSKIYQI